MAPTRKPRNWSREETLCLISVWGERRFQRQFETMVHNHTIWEQIYQEVVSKCPKVEDDFGDWGKLKDRIDYLKKRYRDCIKHNRRTGSDPKKSPYFEEMDAVLGCRPITDPGEDHMDNRSSEDERQSELVAPSTPSDYLEQDTTSSTTECLPDNQENVAGPSSIPARCSQPSPGPDPTPSNGGRKRKGKKTQVMEAVEKGLDRIFQHEAASGGDFMRYERDRLEWEKEAERNRMDFERCRLDFEMRRMEADERRSRENRDLIMQLFQCLRPTAFPPTTPFNYSPYPSYLAPSEVQFGPPAPSATPVSHPKPQSHPPSLP